MLKSLTLAVATLLLASTAWSQDETAKYPAQPVRIIVTVPPGGGVDAVTRIVADKLHQRFGQPVVVENRGGQAGNFGAAAAFAAEPDGYTLMASQPAPLTVNALLYRKLNYDPVAFLPISIMTTVPNTLTVRSDFPAKTAQEFIAYARANPGKLNYASQGTGTTSHLTAELFQRRTGTKLVHVPYKGTGPALNDLIGGQVDLMFTELASALELSRAGKVRILAVTSVQRAAELPDVPTLIVAGVPDFVSETWNGISAPPGTPPEIVAKLNAGILDALNMPEVRAHLAALNLHPANTTPAQAAEFIAVDARRWADVIHATGITAE
ncbi:MAG: tripartite tricarboxylate transporter substrate binding protein [Xanthobacteraceae bacterium]|nr:tripartite tricarboxylate transporter substrate binding protein [Xanthobacteraceae bacterium]